MFTRADIRDIAVQIEENGEKAYRDAARQTDDAELARMFEWMADEEKRHAQWFRSFEDDKPLTGEQLELEKMGRQLLKEMIAGQTFSMDEKALRQVDSIQDMVEQAKSFEKDTALFYQFMKGIVDDEEVEKQLQIIIDEEERHFRQLQSLLATGIALFEPS